MHVVQKEPGFLSQELLQNQSESGPSHVHVMRWRTFSDWQRMQATPEFAQALQSFSGYFAFGSSSFFAPAS
jgi:heme-degrading monooxygenase HmoA